MLHATPGLTPDARALLDRWLAYRRPALQSADEQNQRDAAKLFAYLGGPEGLKLLRRLADSEVEKNFGELGDLLKEIEA